MQESQGSLGYEQERLNVKANHDVRAGYEGRRGHKEIRHAMLTSGYTMDCRSQGPS